MRKTSASIAIIMVASSFISDNAVAASSSPSTLTTVLNLLLGPDPTGGVATGQPNQSCQAQPPGSTPGNSANAPGSAFNPTGTAGMNYAGQKAVNQKNPTSVAQYDVACFNQATKH